MKHNLEVGLEAVLDTIRKFGYVAPDKRGDVEAINIMRHRRAFAEPVESREDAILRRACMHLFALYGQLTADQLLPPCTVHHVCVDYPNEPCLACEWGKRYR
jgi:hypothetical protein